MNSEPTWDRFWGLVLLTVGAGVILYAFALAVRLVWGF
jgi:hypothetical protein